MKGRVEMMNKRIIPVVSAADDHYAPYLSVMMMTLLKHLADNSSISFYIIDDHISKESKEKLNQVIFGHSAEINYLEVNSDLYADVLESDHITQTAYYRISLPDLLSDKHYKKVVYIDCDVLVLEDVSKLYDTDIGEKIIGAVIDPGQALVLDRLGVNTDDYYFNSGLLLINLERWREADITEKTLNFLEEEEDKIIYHDQDALNAILYEKWFQLHPKWNVQTSLLFERHQPPTVEHKILYKEAIQNPAIVHFTGHDKPWNSKEYHPYTQMYLNELAKTPFQQQKQLKAESKK